MDKPTEKDIDDLLNSYYNCLKEVYPLLVLQLHYVNDEFGFDVEVRGWRKELRSHRFGTIRIDYGKLYRLEFGEQIKLSDEEIRIIYDVLSKFKLCSDDVMMVASLMSSIISRFRNINRFVIDEFSKELESFGREASISVDGCTLYVVNGEESESHISLSCVNNGLSVWINSLSNVFSVDEYYEDSLIGSIYVSNGLMSFSYGSGDLVDFYKRVIDFCRECVSNILDRITNIISLYVLFP